ncbi:LysR family transcriptional regulator [Rhizobium sp. CFBP 8762]|uniref:LysR family transcriptional regulator n=1 Tax=Rhizobium sp. CFBP 8762 TaxID=2775279 RepID=UPI001786150E|nr:LysR family transcriptional regulator [Rhizobium sp. CFBP 8762]MBD8554564.1 LysR family transcriptional regulator [Rhizobium sp. CFBP 8762]
MDLNQLRCFVTVADELHFGRAAQKLGLMPASLSRHIRLLEESLGTRLMARTTRHVALTADGQALLEEARDVLMRTDAMRDRFRQLRHERSPGLRIGAIDSAAAGLLPLLLYDFRERYPNVPIQLMEDKTIKLVPRLLSGRLDLAFIRAPDVVDPKLKTEFLFYETAVVAMSTSHRLASCNRIRIKDLADEPLIVPERRSRPHSHDLTMRLFIEAGLQARVAQLADEKQTIVNLVAANIGLAIVPQWTSRLAVEGVCYIELDMPETGAFNKLPLSVAWTKGVRDPTRDNLLTVLKQNIPMYARVA